MGFKLPRSIREPAPAEQSSSAQADPSSRVGAHSRRASGRYFDSFFATADELAGLYIKRPFMMLKWPGAEQK
jgi:hypothetical protein